MIALLSILTLLALWSLLAAIECIPWPLQRHSPIYSNDPDYLAAVVRESQNYLAAHVNASATVRSSVEAMGRAARQRLEGMTR